jgi:NAD+ diphosphatase
LNKRAFFFQGTSLLLLENETADKEILEIPLIYANSFPQADIFTIPIPGAAIFGVDVSFGITLPPHWKAIQVRQIISTMPTSLADRTSASSPKNINSSEDVIPRLLWAFHVAQWRRESVFCGSCGCKNGDVSPYKEGMFCGDAAKCNERTDELARLCPSCGRMEFPRIAPAIIVLITNDEDKILLAHNKKFSFGLYSLIAGFVEAGENLEEAVIREIQEEVNIGVNNLKYLASQPWPFPNSLMIGFSAKHASGTIKPDGIEIEDAQWFSRDKLPILPSPGSVSRYLIERWLAG